MLEYLAVDLGGRRKEYWYEHKDSVSGKESFENSNFQELVIGCIRWSVKQA
jgi:hypothetical protein